MLAEIPLVFILVGLAAYAVLAGADFGAGFWTLTSGGGPRGQSLRAEARHAIGPVWEANHVWLIFVLVVCWTAYPPAFSSITSTLAVPLFVAAVGIILRGSAYALRGQAASTREGTVIDRIFGLSSILTPFALGAAVGAIASGRVPVGNAQGDLVTSWLNPTSVAIGVLATATGAYLAAVYLAADANRRGNPELAETLRLRALAAGVVTGAAALAGLLVVRSDVPRLWDGLTHGAGLAAVLCSAASGVATLALVASRRLEAARATAALAVVAVIAGWALAQRPLFLPGLTVEAAAAGRSTLIAVIIAVAAGCVVLLPSLALLYALVLGGRFDRPQASVAGMPGPARRADRRTWARAALAISLLGLGTALIALTDSSWAHAAGLAAYALFVALVFPALATAPPEG
jgi:cytochrome d ubiquinol oxidase subunit II